ncbi:MAG: hypothetical protein AAGD04_14920 [Pseudomonadota bacterium]
MLTPRMFTTLPKPLKRRLFLSFLSFTLVVPMGAVANEDAERLAEILLANDCKLTSEVAATVLPEAGFDRVRSIDASRTLMMQQRAGFAEDEETLVLLDPRCPE